MALFPKIMKSEPSIISKSWNPFREMRNLQRDMDRLFSETMGQMDIGSGTVSQVEFFEPSCDLEESETHFLLSSDIPGMKKENIKIEMDSNNVLKISGDRKTEHEEKKGTYFQKERFYGAFQRSFALPGTVKAEQIEAQYADGVLKVAIPKAEPTKITQIKIGEGKSIFTERKH